MKGLCERVAQMNAGPEFSTLFGADAIHFGHLFHTIRDLSDRLAKQDCEVSMTCSSAKEQDGPHALPHP